MPGTGELYLSQEDGGPPTELAAGRARGESGVSVRSLRFQGGAHIATTPQDHLVCCHLNSGARFECSIAGQDLTHAPGAGSLAICPAGADTAAHADDDVEAILVTVTPGQLALAAAEASALEAKLIERLAGRDARMAELARVLARESADGYLNGPLYWNDVATDFIAALVAGHTSAGAPDKPRGKLGGAVLARLRDYILAHLDEPIEVETLAGIAARSPFHFTRVFSQSVGVTPHRYVVHLRLRRAIELVRAGGAGLAEIAARTGFADQSHLSRWMRRVHGVSPTEVAA
jgi:AraC family transcriptional regulator